MRIEEQAKVRFTIEWGGVKLFRLSGFGHVWLWLWGFLVLLIYSTAAFHFFLFKQTSFKYKNGFFRLCSAIHLGWITVFAAVSRFSWKSVLVGFPVLWWPQNPSRISCDCLCTLLGIFSSVTSKKGRVTSEPPKCTISLEETIEKDVSFCHERGSKPKQKRWRKT